MPPFLKAIPKDQIIEADVDLWYSAESAWLAIETPKIGAGLPASSGGAGGSWRRSSTAHRRHGADGASLKSPDLRVARCLMEAIRPLVRIRHMRISKPEFR